MQILSNRLNPWTTALVVVLAMGPLFTALVSLVRPL
jgi:hypothetical protein